MARATARAIASVRSNEPMPMLVPIAHAIQKRSLTRNVGATLRAAADATATSSRCDNGVIAAMHIRPGAIFAVIWIAWVVSWIVAAFWSSRTEKRVVTWETWRYGTFIVVGAFLLSHVTPRLLRETRLYH